MITENLALTFFDELDEGLLLIEESRVISINAAAAKFLEVEAQAVRGLPLIAVVRDHRIEQVFLHQEDIELETRGRILQARAFAGGIILQDMSELRRTAKSARELLAVLSHELRTPVTAIRATLEALRYEMPAEQRQRFMQRAGEETERLVRLLEDLTVDVKPPQMRSIILSETVERSLGILQETLLEHDVKVELALPQLTVWADKDKLLQVLINLLENAAVHGPSHKTIKVEAGIDPLNQAFAKVVVQDQGEPLPLEHYEQLFELHARGASVKTRGTGLGLYIVRSIVQRWDGTAWGRPLEQGNEFGFNVPLR